MRKALLAAGLLIALLFAAALFYSTSASPLPQATATPGLTPQAFLPLVMRNYPPLLCSIPTLLEPENGAQLDTLAPLFRWDVGDDPDAVRFEMQLATAPDFQEVIFTLVTFWLGQTEERLPFNLYPDTEYYWRGRLICQGDEGEQAGPWTQTWSFTAAPAGGDFLRAPMLTWPLNVTVQSPVTFQWEPVEGAEEYGLYWRRQGENGYAYVHTTNTAVSIFLEDGDWEWWVRARSSYAWGEPSVMGRFTVSGTMGAGQAVPAFEPLRCENGKCVRR